MTRPTGRRPGKPYVPRGLCRFCGDQVPDRSTMPYAHMSCYLRDLRATGRTAAQRKAAHEFPGRPERGAPSTRVPTDDPIYVARVGWTGHELETRRATLERLAREWDARERDGTLDEVPAEWRSVEYGGAA